MIQIKRRALKNTIFYVCFFCIAVFSVSGIAADTVGSVESAAESSVLDPSIRSELEKNGNIARNQYKNPKAQISLYPRTLLGEALLDTWKQDYDPVFIAETLYLLKKPVYSDGFKNDADLISKVVRSISTMEGIPYYSNSEKAMRTLYLKSYTINNPEDKQRIPDMTEGSADGVSLYVFQEDGTFGKNVYEVEYTQRENEISMVIRNLVPMKVSFITAVKPENLVLSLLIVDEGEDLLVYLLAQIKFPALSMLENTLNRSFSSRLDATYNWFEKEYLAAKKREAEGVVE